MPCENGSLSHRQAAKSLIPKAKLTVLFGHVKGDELGGWEVIIRVC